MALSSCLGKKEGVAKIFTEKFPNVICWHCIAHRLELGVHDTVEKVAGSNNFKIFMDKLYALYRMSPKNNVELRMCASDVEIELLTIGKMLDTRWVASSLRNVRAVWVLFPALYKHFQEASMDSRRDALEKRKYSGLAVRISMIQFVQNLGIMMDALTEISSSL